MTIAVRAVLCVVALACGCGRVGFDDRSDAGMPPGLDSGIVHAGMPRVVLIGDQAFMPTTAFDAWLPLIAQSTAAVSFPVTIDDAQLVGADVIILRVLERPYTDAESAAVLRAVEAGAGLIALTGYYGFPKEQVSINSVLARSGVSFSVIDLVPSVTTFLPHSINAGISEVAFMGGMEINAGNGVYPTAKIGRQVVGAVTGRGNGRIYLWGDDWVMFDSGWSPGHNETWWQNAFAWVWPTQ